MNMPAHLGASQPRMSKDNLTAHRKSKNQDLNIDIGLTQPKSASGKERRKDRSESERRTVSLPPLGARKSVANEGLLSPHSPQPPVRLKEKRGSLKNRTAAANTADKGPATEKCSVCTLDDAWMVYSVFRGLAEAGSPKMVGKPPPVGAQEPAAPQRIREITRHAFLEGLKIEPTLTQLRVLRRAGLANRFRGSPSPVTMEEFFKMVWPKATRRDMRTIMEWTRLNDAYNIIHDQNFRGSVEELREVFRFLDKDGDETLTPMELERARILSPGECMRLYENFDLDGDGTLDFNEFVAMLQPSISKKYVSEKTKRKIQAEEDKKEAFADMRGVFGFGKSDPGHGSPQRKTMLSP